jgi:CDP-diacylglycerol--glycerol-3-phosphate 3-phosphatidyltransferase
MFSPLPSARMWATAIAVLAALTDRYDGILARRRHQETEWGRILDPVADKVGVGCAVVVLLILGELPLWFVGLVLGRDLLILAGGLVLKARRDVVIPSNIMGKWTVGALALLIVLLVIGVSGAVTFWLMFVCVVMLGVSLLQYVRVFVTALAAERKTG